MNAVALELIAEQGMVSAPISDVPKEDDRMDPRQALAVMGALGEGVLPRRKQPTTYVTLERKPKVVRDKSNRVRDPKHKGRRR